MNVVDKLFVVDIRGEEGGTLVFGLHRKREGAHQEAALHIKEMLTQEVASLNEDIVYHTGKGKQDEHSEEYIVRCQVTITKWLAIRQLLSQEKIPEAIVAFHDLHCSTIEVFEQAIES